ncbi:MAG: TetR/AcrR family transcriptional regulator [Myxococcota bacterium]
MTTSTTGQKDERKFEDARKAILERAALLICEQGYEGTSMQQIAVSCGLTKAGLYHYVESKEELLADIMTWGMDIFEEQVLKPVQDIEDPLLRLEECMRRNVLLCTRGWSREITVILHEHQTLRNATGRAINARKKKYVAFLEESFREAMGRKLVRAEVDPTIAAFSFLGTVLWIYKWFRKDGRLTDEQVADGMVDTFFNGIRPLQRSGR